MSEKKTVWRVGSWQTLPLECEVIKETEKQIKCVEVGRGYEHTLRKGENGFSTKAEAGEILLKKFAKNIEILKSQIEHEEEKIEKICNFLKGTL